MPRTEEESKKKAFPNKESRYQCWDARDKFWECLDKNNKPEDCAKEREPFENLCPPTWVKYFDRRKVFLQYQAKMKKDGYDPLNDLEDKQSSKS